MPETIKTGMLGSADIEKLIGEGEITIDPNEGAVGPSSIDMSLSEVLFYAMPLNRPFNPTRSEDILELFGPPFNALNKEDFKEHNYKWPDNFDTEVPHVFLPSEGFLLGRTVERIAIPNNVSGEFHGKSSVKRIGTEVCGDSTKLNPGDDLRVTLELSSELPDTIGWPVGRQIVQVSLFWTGELSQEYSNTSRLTNRQIDYDNPAGMLPGLDEENLANATRLFSDVLCGDATDVQQERINSYLNACGFSRSKIVL